MVDILSSSEVTILVGLIVANSLSTANENKANYTTLIQLARNFKMYNELLSLITNSSIDMIKKKTPKALYKPEIHGTNAYGNPYKVHTDDYYNNNITNQYKSILDDIANSISNYDQNFRINFKFLRQLESIQEIYELITNDKIQKALEVRIFIIE